MKEYTRYWDTYKFVQPTDRGNLTIEWSDVQDLARWSNMQAGLYLQNHPNNLQLFFEQFPRWYDMFWTQRSRQGCFALPDGAKIIDIGSGVAVIDLLLYSYIPNSRFWLVDVEGFEFAPGIYYENDYPCYHSWAPVKDAIRTSGFDPNRFVMQDPDAVFPEEVDCITSYLSWGWHYPKDKYWDRVMNSLKIGGKLIMDVRIIEDRDIVEEISEDMKSTPVLHPFGKIPAHVDNKPSPDPVYTGYRCVWTRKG